jgi:endonuclease/exonuclease/phosphatase family metal-dependent hydrolase
MFSRTFRPIAESMPIIATGDFNTRPRDEERYKKILGLADGPAVFKDAMDLSVKNLVKDIPSDANEEETQYHVDMTWTIDHILIAGPVEIEVANWTQDSSGYEPQHRWPSDHPAVYSEINLRMR